LNSLEFRQDKANINSNRETFAALTLFLETNMADYNTATANAGSRTAAIDAGLRAHMNKVSWYGELPSLLGLSRA
jgi:hypothetical protein